MRFTGNVQWVGNPRSGTSAKTGKDWNSFEFAVVDKEARYQDGFVFSAFNKDAPNIGDEVEVEFYGEAREYQGRWYNRLQVTGIKVIQRDIIQQPTQSAPLPPPPSPSPLPPSPSSSSRHEDELPF